MNDATALRPGDPAASAIRAQVALSNKKNVGLALGLALFFGPLGMLYATVKGGLIMLPVSILGALFTAGFGLFATWPICIIWAYSATKSHNAKIDADVLKTLDAAENH